MALTKELITQNIPRKLHSYIDSKFMDQVNNLITDELVRTAFLENFMTYTNVLKEGKYNIQDYLNAVHYVTHRLLGSGITEAYSKTFPDRYMKLVQRGAEQKDIASFSTAYNKNKLVNLILEQSMVPVHVLNADKHQKAINKLAEIMGDDDATHRSQIDAATALLTHLKAPEVSKVQIDINATESDEIAQLKETTRALAAQQRRMLEDGHTDAVTVAESSIVKSIPKTP